MLALPPILSGDEVGYRAVEDFLELEAEMDEWTSIQDELEALNQHLARAVEVRRPFRRESLDSLQGLVLREDEILDFLNGHNSHPSQSPRADEPRTIAAEIFGLSRAEEQCLLLGLACEIDSHYGKVIAFLQDDVTRRRPTIGLAIELFWGRERFAEGRFAFLPDSAMARHELIEMEDASLAPFTERAFRLDDRIAGLLLGSPELDSNIAGRVAVWTSTGEQIQPPLARETYARTVQLAASCIDQGEARVRPVFYLYGRAGSGRESLARFVCAELGLSLLSADVRRLPVGPARADALVRLGREALLQPAAIYLANFDLLWDENQHESYSRFLDAVARYSPLTFLSGSRWWNAPLSIKQHLFVQIECPTPDANARIELWNKRLQGEAHDLDASHVEALAVEFHFTEGQICESLLMAKAQAAWKSQPPAPLGAEELQASCRTQATPHLGDLAHKVEPRGSWDDLVLPDAQKDQLREIVTHVRRSQTVLDEWGFGKSLSSGRGLAALFEGTSGTGKTTAASMIAAELGLDLYKIDLAGVINKYIGETEKNLSRIFDEAQDSNAILFFDEAEALFAKRSEMVKDANDRYAGIETAHLLQRLEAHRGVVFLATNMKQNLDEAFVRRLRFIIHFPFPSDEDRELIWRRAFPAAVPLAADLDFRWLARKFRLTAGHIKNISLRAAFLALDRGGTVTMDCILDAARRETEKIGKVYDPADFRVRATSKLDPVATEVA